MTAVVEMETLSGVVREYPVVSLNTYLKLWNEVEEIGIWELPPGEYWPYRELVESQGSAAGIRAPVKREDYGERFLIDGSMVEVRVRVGEKTHGFMKYDPENLKEQRYHRIQDAIWRSANLDTILADLLQRARTGR